MVFTPLPRFGSSDGTYKAGKATVDRASRIVTDRLTFTSTLRSLRRLLALLPRIPMVGGYMTVARYRRRCASDTLSLLYLMFAGFVCDGRDVVRDAKGSAPVQ